MKLQIFDRSTCHKKVYKIGYRSVSLTRANGNVAFSKQAAEEMKLGEYQSIIFACDTESKNNAWYIRLMKHDEGIPLKLKAATGYSKGKGKYYYLARSRTVTAAILDSLKAKTGARLLIDKNPVTIEGDEWYGLISAKPLRVS